MVTTGHWQTESRNNPLCCFIGGHISVAVNTTIRGHLTNMAEGLTFIQGWHVWSADITQGLKPSSNFYISIPQTWLKSKKDNSPKHKQGKVEHNEIHNKKLPAQNTQKDNLSTFTHHSPVFLSGTKKQKRLIETIKLHMCKLHCRHCAVVVFICQVDLVGSWFWWISI